MRRIDGPRLWTTLALAIAAVGLGAGTGSADEHVFMFAGEPIHPGCLHAIAMRSGDRIPVATAVSLEGCAASERTRAEIRRDPQDRDLRYIEDEALLGEGSFGYRVVSTLQNGLFVVAIRRTDGEGIVRASLAALDLVERPALRDGHVGLQKVLETVGEVWLESFDVVSLRTMGNVVQYVDGVGPERVERTIDFSRITRARRK